MNSNVTIGQRILTADGEAIGEVKQIDGEYLLVDAPMEADYWLELAAVRGVSEDNDVIVDFEYGELGEYRARGGAV